MKAARDPIARFMQEHDKALAQLKLLNKAVSAFRQDGFSAKYCNHIAVSLTFIEKEVLEHNLREERALFPVLERHVTGPTQLLRKEHKKLRIQYVKLKTAVDKMNTNKDSFSAIKKMSEAAKDTIQLLVNHIHKENYILFPLIRKFISKDEMREIARRMA
jgi:hemerythrin-like domain-containing protein